MLSDDELLEWITDNLEAIAVIARKQPDAAVPSCPGWSTADVVEHIAPIMMGWYCHNLVTCPEDGGFVAAATSAPPMPADLSGRIDYLRRAAEKFGQVVTSADLDAPVWTFGCVGSARFWLLRAATESAIHRWDAETAIGPPTAINPAAAAVSVDETIRGMWRAIVQADWPAGVALRRPALPVEPLGIRATDSGRAWRVSSLEGRLLVAETGDLPEVTIEGNGHDLMLYLWGRHKLDPRCIHGSPETAAAWNLNVCAGL